MPQGIDKMQIDKILKSSPSDKNNFKATPRQQESQGSLAVREIQQGVAFTSPR